MMTKGRWAHWWVIGAAALAAAFALAVARRPSPRAPLVVPGTTVSPATNGTTTSGAPQLPASPFLNTGPEATYAGTQSCLECHRDQHESFRHTGMARSMASVDLEREPPDAQFDHGPSQRRYEVRRAGGRMWHREWKLAEGAEPVLLQEHPVTYVTGSGRHSLTYVVEVDGFLVESPITWYASRQAWGMSPGYDRPGHSSFQREVGESCLICHAGQVETIDRSLHRVRVIEEAIGCERCHGPGSLHVAKRREQQALGIAAAEEAIDHTIVNPAHLSRELAEAVCQQCHLRVSATVLLRSRGLNDYRPGLPLDSFRQDYTLHDPEKSMTVVGHVEQMHRSACYEGSSTFTCVTCHNPHGEPPPEERIGYYNAICASCHPPQQCTVDAAQREQESPEDNCLHCHMPTTPTDIPHLAFTHHRVGIHESPPADHESRRRRVLSSFLGDTHLDAIERKRALGLGYLDVAIHEEDPAMRVHYQRESQRILLEVFSSGAADGVVLSALASLDFEMKLGEHGPLAQLALTDASLEGLPRCNALFLVADGRYRLGRYNEAVDALDPLGRLRRHSLQWLLRAECEKQLGNSLAVEKSLLQAVSIDPSLESVHKHLAEIYREQGNEERARFHEVRSAP